MPTTNRYTPAGSQPPVTSHSDNLEQHYPHPAVIAIFGMSLLGIAAMMAQWLKDGWISRWWIPYAPILTLLLCGIIGAIVGFVSIPFVSPSLKRNNWLATATRIYGTNCLLVVAYVMIKPTGLTGPLSAALIAFVGVAVIAQVLRFMKT